MLLNVLAMVAEFGFDLVRMRTRERMKIAKPKGVCGNQPKLNHRQEAPLVALLNAGEYSTAELAYPFGLARLYCLPDLGTRANPASAGVGTSMPDKWLRCPAGTPHVRGLDPLRAVSTCGKGSERAPVTAGLSRRL